MFKKNTNKVRVMALGGLNEIGKNMTLIEYKDEIVVIDAGLSFPEDEMLGVDIVIPDITYLLKNKDKVKGIFITHGHEDHIGALPYILKKIDVPVYGTRFSIGLIEAKLKEHKLNTVKLNVVTPKQIIKLKNISVEFIKNNHSIPGSCSLAVHTEQGVIFHTGDFKIDLTPIDGDVMDIHRICELGSAGVLLMLADSTNVEKSGFTMSEKTVGAGLDDLFRKANGSRIIVATFASNVHRLQQIINMAVKFNRKVAISGRSMVNVIGVAKDLGYLDIEDDILIDLNDISKYDNSELVIITTGTQGEPMSALARMACSEHKKVEIIPGDLVIISAHPIPGNEKLISKVINLLFERGARVVYNDIADIHVSGHAAQEDLKLINRMVKPKFFMPVHGEYRMLKRHAELANELGMAQQNVFVMQTGQVLELDRNSARVTTTVPTGNVLVDGLGVGDVGNIVLRDRKHLSEDGLMIVVVTISKEDGKVLAGPDIISRGFVYVRESEDLMDGAKTVIKDVLNECEEKNIKEWAYLKNNIKENLKEYLDKLPEYDHIILTSVNGVNNFFDYLIETGYDVRNIKAKFSVVGKATKKALINRGIVPFIMAREFVGEGLFKVLEPHLVKGEKVLIPCSSSSRSYLYDEISALGLHVDRVHTYDTVCGTVKNKRVFDEVDYVLFTSPSTVTNMIDMLGIEAIREKKLIAIGPQTAKAINANNMECFVCRKHSEEGFLKEIIEFKEAENV